MRPSFGKDFFLSILAELSVAFFFAVVTPLLIRYCLLPSSIHHQYPLNVVFHTCDHDLHSVCSFPAATLEYEKNSLFSPNVAYHLNIRLKFADVANTNKLGLFQNVITVTDENQKTLKQYTKTAYIKEPGTFSKAVQLLFFPLYFLGFFSEYNNLIIPMSADYMETSEAQSTKLVFTIQDKFANIEEAELTVTASFGWIRHLLYYWPTTAYTILFLSVFAIGVFLVILKLGYEEYSARSSAALEKDRDEIFKKKDKVETPSEEIKKDVKTEEITCLEVSSNLKKRK